MLDSLAAFWGKVAQEFVDNPYILGYEIINEPWAGEVKKGTKEGGLLPLSFLCVGDLYADLELAIPKVADRRNLAKVYEVVMPTMPNISFSTASCYHFWFQLQVNAEIRKYDQCHK